MAKYRLSYLKIGGILESINLHELECLKGRKVTDIKTIDEFTSNFNNEEELLTFLKRNHLINNTVNKLYITIDEKIKNTQYTKNKKIYNGDILIFKDKYKYLNTSYIYKCIINNKENPDFIIAICNNYIEKYKNAFNRTRGASYILSLYNRLKSLAYGYKNNSLDNMLEYENAVSEFIDIEFYKIDKNKYDQYKILEKKKDSDGLYIRNYRNIHDFIILINSLDLNLNKYDKKEIFIEEIDYKEETEEFLTEDDFKRSDKILLEGYRKPKGDSIIDGNDYYTPISKPELRNIFNELQNEILNKQKILN